MSLNPKPLDQDTIDRIADAIGGADVSFSMNLTRLVDGVHTYTLSMDGKVEEFEHTDDLYLRVREIKQRKQAEAVISAFDAGQQTMARRYHALCQWYLSGQPRSAIHEHGHIEFTTQKHIDDWADRIAKSKGGAA